MPSRVGSASSTATLALPSKAPAVRFTQRSALDGTRERAASAEVSARYDVVFQQALMSYYTGELDPTRAVWGA